jgi:hypothetical protein
MWFLFCGHGLDYATEPGGSPWRHHGRSREPPVWRMPGDGP